MAAGRTRIPSWLTAPGRTAAVLAVAVAFAAVCAVDATAGDDQKPPTAVAGYLPKSYRLLLTESYGARHVARYGTPRVHGTDGPLVVTSVRGRGKPPYEHSPSRHPGDRRTTVRGRPAVIRKLTDEGRTYARELIWRERRDLVVAVDAAIPTRKRKLRRVAEHIRILDQRAWARLHSQTSYEAQAGRVTRDMPRLRVKRGRLRGRSWNLFALIPPHFPLSRDDLRASCVELRYRRHRGHGDYCGELPNWQRVGGAIFVFGETERRVKHLRIRPDEGHAFDLRVRTARAPHGPHVRYFAVPLPEGTCGVHITPAAHPHAEGTIAMPTRGPDHRRCAGGRGGPPRRRGTP
jgi:hypothetical protein